MILADGQALNFAPQALGEVAPIASATGYFYADQGIELLNRFALYGQMYRGQPWVATVVDKVSNSAARLSFNSWDNSGAGEKVLDTQSPFAQLWRRPCPFMHRYAFWRWTFSTYEIYGEAFWLKLRAPGSKRVIGLLPMHPSRTIVKRLTPQEQAELGYASNTQYIFSLSVPAAGLLKVPEEDVVPFLRYNPDDLMRGVSRIEALRTTLYNEDASRRAIESWWKRGARPSLMISSPQGLSDKAYERLQATVSKVHGGADQMGGTLVLEEGAKPVPVQLSAEEMQYIQARTLNREEVCGVYDVPPPVVHILDHATFSNITEQMRSMYRDTMAPRLEDVESVVEHHLTEPDFPEIKVEGRFALDEVLRGDFETRATAVGSLIEKGVMKPSEARPLFDLDDAGPVADKLYANSALQELGTPAARITVTDRTAVATPGETAAATEANQEVADEIDSEQPAPKQPPPTAPTGRSARRRRQRRGLPSTVSKAASGYDVGARTGMVSLDIPDGTLPALSGGVSDHHITICFLGPDVDDDTFADVLAHARSLASDVPGPVTGTVSGIGSFEPSESSDGRRPVYAVPDVPAASGLHDSFADWEKSSFTDYHPHVTLAYITDGDPLPEPVPEIPVSFTHLSVHRGDEVHRYPFRAAHDAEETQ